LTYLSFALFNAPYNPVRFMYEKRTASSQFLMLRLIIRREVSGLKGWNALGEICS